VRPQETRIETCRADAVHTVTHAIIETKIAIGTRAWIPIRDMSHPLMVLRVGSEDYPSAADSSRAEFKIQSA